MLGRALYHVTNSEKNKYVKNVYFAGDDENGINIASLFNAVDDALLKYDVDTKTCMARTMCNQYAKRNVEGEEEAVRRISRGLIQNIAE